MIFFIFGVILFLYFKTYKYNYLIDDHVERMGMYTQVPPPPVPVEFGKRYDDNQRSYLTTFTNIGTFLATCFVIRLLFGWRVALLFAVMPTNVSGVAWKTGNYYMTTAFLILTAYYFFIMDTWWSVLLAYVFFSVSPESTISAIPFPILCTYLNPSVGWVMFLPLIRFFISKRFRDGVEKRKKEHEKIGYASAFIHWTNIPLAIQVFSYYLLLSTGFMRMGFFHTFGRGFGYKKINKGFYPSFILLILFLYISWNASPLGTIWFLVFISPFCQLLPNLGQFVTERYMYIANVGVVLSICSLIQDPILYTILCTLWFMISRQYINAWKNNISLFSHGITSFPECPDNYNNLAGYYIDKGLHMRAINPLMVAIKYTLGNKFKLQLQLANCYASNKQYKEALRLSKMALETAEPDKIDDIKEQVDRLERIIRYGGA